MHARLVADAKKRCYAEGAEELIKEYDAIMADPNAILEIGKWLCVMDEEERQCGDCTLADTWRAIDWLIAEKHDMICGMFKQYRRIPKWVCAEFVWSSKDVENEIVGVNEGEDVDEEDMEMMDEKLVDEKKTNEEMIDVNVVRENVPSAKTPKAAKNKAGDRKGKKRYRGRVCNAQVFPFEPLLAKS
jgi:hypothetical protein